MTETARLADYVLPAPSQFEKWEATFFNFDFPRNVFHLRRPLLEPLPGTLPEPEIHARLVRGARARSATTTSRRCGRRPTEGRAAFADAFFAALGGRPELGALAPIVLYRTLGPTLPDGAAAAAVLWGAAHRCAQENPDGVRRAGFAGEGLEPGERLFDAILASPSGLVFSVDEHETTWRRVAHRRRPGPPRHPRAARRAGRRWPTEAPPGSDPAWPVRAVGRRAPVVHRQHDLPRPGLAEARRRAARCGSARPTPTRLGVADGGRARVTTKRGSVVASRRGQRHDAARPRLAAERPRPRLPGGRRPRSVTGVAPNELTASEDRDRMRRHAVAQARAGPAGGGGLTRLRRSPRSVPQCAGSRSSPARSRGIGAATAVLAAEHGYDVAIGYRTNEPGPRSSSTVPGARACGGRGAGRRRRSRPMWCASSSASTRARPPHRAGEQRRHPVAAGPARHRSPPDARPTRARA